ncbi:DNA topoisomerase IB [Sphingomonas prati]|uniref:DNA topoisomerase n=2 Tax=Sphingomonas prati TaxID=1843237 RepID=A0A7W9F447_9SPHN|nr:DNA topoisomerase IB [Sphingomonas prati]MBB5730130.1 DNA topoisomerase-1 [Sphingomonas prati]
MPLSPHDRTEPPPMLSYVDDALPGITRRKLRGHWAYFDPHGERVRDRVEIDRLNATAMPPAYVDCWFCPSPDGHIQAVGWDDKGRKQYRYHADFRATQEAAKYDACADFGRALPLLRARVEEDLTHRALDKDAVVAAIVRLLDLGRVRVGNETYAKSNNSFGATTLRADHAKVRGSKLKLEYVGKSGKLQRLTIEDQRLSRIARRCQDLPGQHLFQYQCPDGSAHPVGSADINAYIKDATGGSFTAKSFRTWGASVIAYRTLVEAGDTAITLKQLLQPVADALGNTPAIARKSYVHPALIELARSGVPVGRVRLPRATRYATPTERGLIAFLDTLGAEHCSKAACA